jgi:hypothetical protein
MENNPDNILILTILIQMHGKVINFDLEPRIAHIFDNVRLLCKAGDFVDYQSTPISEFTLVSGLSDYFTHDLAESTYDILKKAKSGVLVDNITYDKSLSIMIGEPTFIDRINPFHHFITNVQGIYLLSIHQGKQLIYPDKNKQVINFLNIDDLQKLTSMFHTVLPNISDLSTEIPSQKIYINEENSVKDDDSISEDEKEIRIAQIREQFYNNLSNWQLTLNGKKIVSIKLSTLVELVKTIIGNNCFINLLDYSCNSPTIYIPKKQKLLKQYALQEPDIEMGIPKYKNFGGKRQRRQIKRTKKRAKRINKINNYKKNKYKKSRKRNC